MLYNFFTNRWVIMVLCAALVFCEMFVAKAWFTSFTQKIKNEKARRGANVAFGFLTCVVLSILQMYALCDVLKATVYMPHAYAAAGIATLVYLVIEKIFTESEVNALGKAFRNYVSHSDAFDGELSPEGVVTVARKLLNIADKIDQKEAEKERKTVDEICAKLDKIMEDGIVTKEEQAEADKLIDGVDLEGNSAYERYKNVLGK